MKRIALFAVLFALLTSALLVANHRRQQTPAYLLKNYPPSANLTYVIEHHTQPASSVIFRSDWFDRETTAMAMGCETDLKGSQKCAVYSENTASPVGGSRLSVAQIARFQTALRALPPGETTAPPLNHLLIVSFRDGQTWSTRLYDRAHPSPQLVRLMKIDGFRGYRSPSQPQ